MNEQHILSLLPRLRGREGRNIKVPCPVCGPTRKKSTEPCLSVKLDGHTILWNCHHCGDAGMYRLEDDGDTRLSLAPERQEVEPVDLDALMLPLTTEGIRFLSGRGIDISKVCQYVSALMGYEVTADKMIGQARKDTNWLAFPMIDMAGRPINMQVRHIKDKRFKLMPGRPLTFYGAFMLHKSDAVIITEGQLDAMAVMQSLHDNGENEAAVVSLPNGSNNMSFDPNAWLVLGQKETIIYAGDTDAPGREAAIRVADRLGRHRVRIVEWPEGCKDANDVLLRHGADAVYQAIIDAKRLPVEGVFTAIDMIDYMSTLITTPVEEDRKTCGLPSLDTIFTWAKGELTLVTGIPGHGKSTFVDQVVVGLAKEAGWRSAILSFEKANHPLHALELVEKWLDKPVIGTYSKAWREVYGDPPASKEEIENAIADIDEHFVFFDVTGKYSGVKNKYTIESIIKKAEDVVHQFGVDCIVIDNMSFIEKPKGEDMDSFLMRVLNQILSFTKSYNVCTILVAHPRKPPAGSGTFIPKGYDVYGTSMIYNKVDNGLTVYRSEEDGTLIMIWKGRSRSNAGLGTATLLFNSEYGTFYSV